MSSICGIFYRNGQSLDPEIINTMVNSLAHWKPDKIGTWHEKNVGFGHLMLFNTPESLHEILPYRDLHHHLVITADARLDNRKELFDILNIPLCDRLTLTDSELILKTYNKWKDKCPIYLVGDFAFAIWDGKNQTLFCARDHVGSKPFFYYHTSTFFAFSTEIRGLLSLPFVSKKMNEQWVRGYLNLETYKNPNEQTFYENIVRLKAAHSLHISEHNLKLYRFWDLDPEREIVLRSDHDYLEAYREKLFEAIECRLRSAYVIGSELSGGLDSSTITAIAAKKLQQRNSNVMTFSNVLRPNGESMFPFKDERSHIELLCKHAGILNPNYITSENTSFLDAVKFVTDLNNSPPPIVFCIFFDALYQRAANVGVRTLLSGVGGDEIPTSQAHVGLRELAAKGKWFTLWEECSKQEKREQNPAKRISGLRYFNSILLQTTLPKVYRLLKQFKHHFYQTENRAVADDDQRYTNLRHYQYHRTFDRGFLMRIELQSLLAASKRIEYRCPFSDKRMLEFCLALPLNQKRRNGWGRFLLRQSTHSILPDEIRWKTDKTGYIVPNMCSRILDNAKILKQNELDFLTSLKSYTDIQIINSTLDYLENNAFSKSFRYHRIITQMMAMVLMGFQFIKQLEKNY